MTERFSRFILYKAEDDEESNLPTTYEAREYHDVIGDMLEDNEFMRLMPHDTALAMQVVMDTLCWTLGHDENGNLAINLGKWTEAYADFRGSEESYDN